MQGYFESVRRGRRVFLVGVVCNNVKCARGARFGRLVKTVPKGAGSYANSGINRQRRFVHCRFVKGKSAAQIVDEHGLDDGLSRPSRKTR